MTFQIASEQLQSEGYSYSVERQGYFVSEIEDEWHYAENPATSLRKPTQPEHFINVKNGQVFPYKLWSRLYRKELNEFNGYNAPWQGEYSLRLQIARNLQKA